MSDFKYIPQGVQSLIKVFEERKELVMRELFLAVQETMKTAKEEIQGRFSAGGVTGPTALVSRTGQLEKSLKTDVVRKGNVLEGMVSSDEIYAAIQEKGGTIMGAPRLAVPLPPAKDGRGVAMSPRFYEGLFPITSRKGNKLLVKREGDNLVPMFVLKESVTLKPGRFGIAATLNRVFNGPVWERNFKAAADRIFKSARE